MCLHILIKVLTFKSLMGVPIGASLVALRSATWSLSSAAKNFPSFNSQVNCENNAVKSNVKRNSVELQEKVERLSGKVTDDSIRHQKFAESATETSLQLLEIVESYPRFKLRMREIDEAERQIEKCKEKTANLRAAAWKTTYEADEHDIINQLCKMVIEAEEEFAKMVQLTEAKRKFFIKYNEASNSMQRLNTAMTTTEIVKNVDLRTQHNNIRDELDAMNGEVDKIIEYGNEIMEQHNVPIIHDMQQILRAKKTNTWKLWHERDGNLHVHNNKDSQHFPALHATIPIAQQPPRHRIPRKELYGVLASMGNAEQSRRHQINGHDFQALKHCIQLSRFRSNPVRNEVPAKTSA